ncbi:MAG: EI24 domain-containing protein [Hyphomonadaceae bacterium]|nr:EI24 domain-containing protein [Hyphomonadaceae bacterium]
MRLAPTAISGGLKDVFGGRLGGWALLCFVVALAATIAAAWGAFRYVWPMIPEGEGWVRYLWNVADVLGGALIVLIAIVLAPTISMIVGSVLFDVAAAGVEKTIGLPAGRLVTPLEGLANGFRIGWPPLVLNILSLPLLFVPVVNIIWFLALNGYLMGREYFSLAAVRRMPWSEARRLRARYGLSIFLVGLACSFIPFVAPLVGASAMTRLVKGMTP